MNRAFPLSFILLLCCAAATQTPAPLQTGAVAAGATTTSSPEMAQFQKIEDAWSNAVNQHDQFGLENVLSPLFVDVAANGDISTRNQQVVQVINSDDKTANLTQKVITVRMLGDIAVVNGTYLLHHKVNAAAVEEKGVFTQVFEKLRGGWMCINSQRTLLHEDTSGGTKTAKKSTTPSSTETPFHIPLFSKSDKSNQ